MFFTITPMHNMLTFQTNWNVLFGQQHLKMDKKVHLTNKYIHIYFFLPRTWKAEEGSLFLDLTQKFFCQVYKLIWFMLKRLYKMIKLELFFLVLLSGQSPIFNKTKSFLKISSLLIGQTTNFGYFNFHSHLKKLG